MATLKRKNGERSSFLDEFSSAERVQLGLIAVGMSLIMALSIGGMWRWWLGFREESAFIPLAPLPRYIAPQPTLPAVAVRASPPPVVLPAEGVEPPGTQVLSWGGGRAYLIIDGTISSLGIDGTDIVIAPQSIDPAGVTESLAYAYLRDDQLYVFYRGHEVAIEAPGRAMMPMWNADGSVLLFATRNETGDSIRRVDFSAEMATYNVRHLITVPALAAPPISHPATGRVLVAEWSAGPPGKGADTIFATIDGDCATHAACERSRQVFATIPYAVNWADYHPTATMLTFSTVDGDGVYVLYTGTGEVKRVDGAGEQTRRPTFDTSGQYVAYLDSAGGAYVTPLTTPHQRWRLLPKAENAHITSVDWVNG